MAKTLLKVSLGIHEDPTIAFSVWVWFQSPNVDLFIVIIQSLAVFPSSNLSWFMRPNWVYDFNIYFGLIPQNVGLFTSSNCG